MWSRRRHDARIAEEIDFHRRRLIEEYIAAGMPRSAAERRAFLEFGNPPEIEEDVRDVRGRWLSDFSKDLQYAVRACRRSPAFFAVAVASLALGIGANTAIFSVINAVMLRSLPIDRSSQLVQLGRVMQDGRPGFVSYPVFEQFRDELKTVSGVFAQTNSSQSIAIDGDDDFVAVDAVSGSYFGVLQLRAAAGRLLGPADEAPAGPEAAAVITDAYWQRRFGRDPLVVGRSFTLRSRVFTIVGVGPAGFQGAQVARAADVIVPLLTMMTTEQRTSLGWNSLAVLGRLAEGATVATANAETRARFSGFMRAQADAVGLSGTRRDGVLRQRAMARSAPAGFNPMRDDLRRPLMLLMGIVVLILVLACVNLSGLLFARGEARRREVSIRLAIGAGRGRLVRQLLTENLLLAAIGGMGGLALAAWLSHRLVTLFVAGRDVTLSVAPDWRVLAFTFGVSLVACLSTGVGPALRAVRGDVNPALKEVRPGGHARLGRLLVAAQCAISMVLVVGATLFVGTLVRLYSVDRGFNSHGVLVVNVRAARAYSPDRQIDIQRALVERFGAIAGVESVGAAQALPVGGGLWDRSVRVEGYTPRPDEPNVGFNVIAPGYFATLQTPRLAGRDFTDRDTATAPKVAIVNESFVRYFFNNGAALGRHVTSVGTTYEIVGVVRDAKYQDLRGDMLRTMYVPWTQYEGAQPSSYAYLLRVAGDDPQRVAPALDPLVRGVDPALRLRSAAAYDAIVDRSIAVERIMATLGAFFGLLALIVAGLGMFGLLAFQVTRRTRELGIRMVLGASRGSMASLVLNEVVALVGVGVALGGGAALALGGLTRTLVFGLAPNDPLVFVVAASALASAALVAAWLPARRAVRVNPLVALKQE